MKNPKTQLSRLLAAMVISAVSAKLPAQTPPTNRPPINDSGEETIELSPFVVNTEKETSYLGGNTLAGTRISSSVKDLGASLSVYTKELMTDLGATNLNGVLIYATGMEAAGPEGNYSGSASDINAAGVFGDAVRRAPQTSRTRGLASPNYTMNNFITNVRTDAYNTASVTVNRGPNAILFGVGSAAGVVETSLLEANLRRDQHKTEFRYGNNDATRASFDFNQVLIREKLGMRIAAVDNYEEYNQRPAFEHQKRVYGTLTAKPFKSTTVRASFESGNTSANRPLTVLPAVAISDYWNAAGQPTFDWRYYDDPALNPLAASQNASNYYGYLIGQARDWNMPIMIYSQPNARSIDMSLLGSVSNQVRGSVFDPKVNRDSATDSIVYTYTLGASEMAAAFFPGGVAPAGLKQQGFTDYSAFDFKNHQFDETGRQGETFHSFNVALEQLGWRDRVGIELAYHAERVDTRAHNNNSSAFTNSVVRIDTTVTLPTGDPNPNVGRPYVLLGENSTWPVNTNMRDAVRVTAFLRYNFDETSSRLGRWLGNHILTGLFEQNTARSLAYSTRVVTTGPASNFFSTTLNGFQHTAAVRVYLGDSVLGNKPLKLQPIQVPPLTSGLTAQTTYFAPPAGPTGQGAFTTGPTVLQEINNGGSASREVIKSKALVLQSRWLDDNLVTTVGWRRDADYLGRSSFTYNTDPTKLNYGLNDFSFPSLPPQAAAKEVATYSAVLRWPHKFAKLPWGMDASVFVNRSENFTPLGGRVDAFNNPLPSPQGQTREYGFNLSFLDDRVSLRVNRFETSAKDATYSGSAYNWLLTFAKNVAVNWTQEPDINPGIDRSADVAAIFNALPTNFRDLYGWKVTGNAAQGNVSAVFSNTVPGVADTSDFVAKGTEFELVVNPSRGWRVLLNVAEQKTIQSDVAPNATVVYNMLKPVWDKFAKLPYANYPAGWVLGNPLPGNVVTIDQALYLASVGAPYVNYALAQASNGVPSAEQRKWRANLACNYTFAEGSKLRGWSVGSGVRWQDRVGIGFPFSRDSIGNAVVDIKHPYWSPPETNVDAWVAYTRKLWADRIVWKAQLNIVNLIGQSGPVTITAQPWGAPSFVRNPPERRWYVTNTFSF